MFQVLTALPIASIESDCLLSHQSQIRKNSSKESSSFIAIRLILDSTLEGSQVTSLDSFPSLTDALILARNTLASLTNRDRLPMLSGSCRFSVLDALTTSSFTMSSIKAWDERYSSS